MKKHFVHLNRRASPLGLLQEFFNYASPAEHTKAFDEFCRAALKEKYCWRRGSPGNALHYAEQLEGLIKAAYLLYKDRHLYRTKTLSVLLTTAAYADALSYLKAFFKQASPAKWKNWLHVFTRAALSHQSAADDMKPVAIYTFITHLQQLLSVAAAIINKNE
jgi:hypothetical protein